ncbi:MAG TPA: hypothetical protein PLN85_02355, partial [archaeon]|nr:hypothetical protein [archaeon]
NLSHKELIAEDIERRKEEELDKYWDRQLRQIKDEKEREREVKRVTTDIINARKVADKFLSLVSTKSVDEFHKWIDENPYDAVMLQNELEEHRLTEDLWKYGFDRTSIPYRRNTIDEYLYDFLTTDVDKINAKYDAELEALKNNNNNNNNNNKTIPDSGATFKSPKTLRELTDKQKEALKGGIKRIVDIIKESKGETPDFKKLVKILVDTYGKAYVDERFEAFSLAYDLQYGLKESDKTDAYMIYIQGLEGAVESFDNLLSGVFVEERSDEVLEKTASVTPAQKVTTSNIKIDKTIAKNTIDNEGKVSSFKDDRLTDSGLKGAYLSLPYTLKVEERDGKFYVTRTTKTDAPLENSENLNSTYVLDPNNLKPGTKLSVRIPENVQNLLVSYWEDLQIDENGIKTLSQPAKFMNKKLMTFGEWEKIPGNQKIINGKLNLRWVAKVPMIASINGNNVFYIHDNEWYSQNTISDFADPKTGIPDYNKQRQTIEAARENLLKVRMEAFQNNGTEITITEKGWGAYTDLSGGTIKGVLTLSDAFKGNTDQAMVGMVKGGRVFINQGGRIVDLESAFPNATIKTMDFGSGSMVDIRQGSTPNTLQVFPLFRNTLSEESATNIGNILRAILGQIGSRQSTIEKIEELTGIKVVNSISNINHQAVVEILSKYIRIGINKDIASAGTPYVEYFETGDYIQFGKFGEKPTTLNLNNKNTNIEEFISFLSSNKIFQNFAIKDFGKEKKNMMFTIDNHGNLTPNGFYGDYVKTQLKTNIATYNIGTEDQPNYITFTQPRIGFTHGGVVEQQPVIEEQFSATETIQADAQNGIDVSEAEVLPPSPASVIISNIEGIKIEAEELGVSIEDPYLDALLEKAKAEEEAQRIALLDKQLAPIRATIDILTEKGFLIPC